METGETARLCCTLGAGAKADVEPTRAAVSRERSFMVACNLVYNGPNRIEWTGCRRGLEGLEGASLCYVIRLGAGLWVGTLETMFLR